MSTEAPAWFSNPPNVWGEGALFAFSGLDGKTNTRSGFVGTCGREPYDLLFHTPCRRLLAIRLAQAGTVRVATNDLLAVDTSGEKLVVTFASWHTLVGLVPEGAHFTLSMEDGAKAREQGSCLVSEDDGHGDALALACDRGQFALAYGVSVEEACGRAEAGLRVSVGDAVDFSCFAAVDMRYVSLIAAELGDKRRATTWRQRAFVLSQKIHHGLWDEQDRFYYDRDLEGNLSRVKAVSGFLPLLLEDIPADHVEGLVEALTDPTQFNTAFPVPSVALADPNWSTDMWRGATWLNFNYLIIHGLRVQGRHDLARWLAAKSVAMVDKYYRTYGVLFEFFDARDAVPPVACDRKGPHVEPYDIRRKMDSIRDYHWTAAVAACLLLAQD